jgi:hypothetical protein
MFSHEEAKQEKWTDSLIKLFLGGKSREAFKAVQRLPKNLLAKAGFDLLQYLDDNKGNVDYLSYMAQGFFIGGGPKGAVAGAALQRRIRQGGMSWSAEGAQAMLSLDAKLRSGLWDSEVEDLAYIHYAGAPSRAVRN